MTGPAVVPFPCRLSLELKAVLPAIGLTSRQLDLAFSAALDSCDDDEARRFVHAWSEVVQTMIKLDRQLETAREQTLSVYLRHYPGAARRILAGKQPRKRKVSGSPAPSISAVPR